MKKLILTVALVLVVLLVAAVVAVGLFLDKAVKAGVETVGPTLTKTDVKLGDVGLSLLSGGGKLKGLVIGNPEGFKSPSAINIGSASLAIQPGSLLADKLVIRSIKVEAPEVTFETDLRANNLSKILANLEEATGGKTDPSKPATPAEAQASKKLQVNEFVVTGGKVHVSLTVLGGKTATIALPDIRLTDLGSGPDGITAADLSKKVLTEIINAASKVAATAATDLAKGATYLSKDLDKTAAGATEKATKAIGDLFKKK
jgi:uncharacterized protein involved in outer membrane biogenesis